MCSAGGGVSVSIHPPRVGRDFGADKMGLSEDVSIHPPRVGRDR